MSDQTAILDWPYAVPTALVQRIVDSAAIERIESTAANWLPYQELRMHALLTHVKAKQPWWDEWLGQGSVEELMQNWRNVPVMQRAQLRDSIAAAPAHTPAEGEAPAMLCATRGTKGDAVALRRTAHDQRLAAHQAHADHLRHGRPFAITRAVVGDLTHKHQGTHVFMPAVGELNELPMMVRNAKQFTPAQHLDWMRQGPIDQLNVATDFLERLLAEMQSPAQAGKPAPRIGHIITGGQTLTNTLREAAYAVFGAVLFDRYLCEEVGPLAHQARGCHEPGAALAYNVAVSHVLLEVLNPDGSHVADGETGQVVVTALHQALNPVIRYDLGDRATWHARCPMTGLIIPSLSSIHRAV